MPDRTTIEVDTSTRDRLRIWKAERGVTYSEAIDELIDRAEEPAEHGAAQAASSAGEGGGDGQPVVCTHCGYEWEYGGSAAKPTCPSCTKKTPIEG